MILYRKFIPTPFRIDGVRSKHKVKRIFILECDECKVTFESPHSYIETHREYHFCTLDCLNASQTHGVIKQKKEQYFLREYGVINPFQDKSCKEKIRNTNFKNLGAAYPMQSEVCKSKSRSTCLETYGYEFVGQCPEINRKSALGHNKSQLITHWKTGEELVCTASYEIAFVTWCNENQIDFDWQIPIKTPLLTSKGRPAVYFVDAFIKSGEFAGTWVEVKGWFRDEESKAKWEWFHSQYPDNSQLWNNTLLKELGVI